MCRAVFFLGITSYKIHLLLHFTLQLTAGCYTSTIDKNTTEIIETLNLILATMATKG